MLLNSELVIKIGDLLEGSLSQHHDIGTYTIEHDLGPEIEIVFHRDYLQSHWTINGQLFDSLNWDYGKPKEPLYAALARRLITLVLEKNEEIETFENLLTGTTISISHESIIGLTVKCDSDVDRRTLMVHQTATPNNVLYAFEEAVNQELSISPELLTQPHQIANKILRLFSDYLMADLITHDIAI